MFIYYDKYVLTTTYVHIIAFEHNILEAVLKVGSILRNISASQSHLPLESRVLNLIGYIRRRWQQSRLCSSL